MKRRNFLKIFPAASVTPFVVNGFPLRPFANRRMAKVLGSCDGVEDRVLVLLQLKGGNDGVNTVIPFNQYDKYSQVRPTVRIEQGKLIQLDSTLPNPDQVGLHPALTALKAMYDDGRAALVQGVGYQSMNQSHFKATDLWFSGGDTTPDGNNLGSGWMGRSLQAFYPDVLGAPTADMPDPLGIQIGDSNPSLGFHTETEHQNSINLTGQDAAGFYSLIQTIGGVPMKNIPDSDLGDEVRYIMSVEQSVNLYAARITQVFQAGSNSISTYPAPTAYGLNTAFTLGDQLKTIARLIKGGCKTKIYLCQIGGFDTHNAQVDSGDTSVGDHASLLGYLADSVKTFFDDLEGLGIAEQVIGCTFSEFGRCAAENGSFGTDHGTLAPMMIFGKHVKAGVVGTNVNLSNLTNDGQLIGMQYDYRQVFATLLQDWLGADNDILEQTMFDGYAKVPLVDAAAVVSPECYFGTSSAFDPYQTARPLKVYPNPATTTAEVSFESTRGFQARLTLHNLGGSLVTGTTVQVVPGLNFFYLDVLGLPAAPYFVRLEDASSGRAEVVKLSVAR
ncbi:MAG TPA: DUF1501 domain-containing protein [Saprospiraceae bacterium]|nr:DUF1501 domain-containing protein [Saprospiraceae bacterium]HND87941.1 DUF1501 domain-containing protein [Saprospiraceae bacterium]